jgi:DNA-binding NtrC family response regulator
VSLASLPGKPAPCAITQSHPGLRRSRENCILRAAVSRMPLNNGTPRKKHVLIVDDDVPLSWSFKETLESRGYDATIVPDGGMALKFVQDHDLDVVVCDLQIFRLEGDLLYAAVERANPSLARRFIFITGADDCSPFRKRAECTELPMLCKPVAVEALLEEVVRMMEPAQSP